MQCPVHGVDFFKKGRMKGYAHPIKDERGEDTGEWCNQQDLADALPEEPKTAIGKEAAKAGAKVMVGDPKNRSFGLSYAKDHIDTIIAKDGLAKFKSLDDSTEQIIKAAKKFTKYLDEG